METKRIAQSGLEAYLAALEVAEALNEREVTLAVQTFFIDEREALLNEREARLDKREAGLDGLEALLGRREAAIDAREERAAEVLAEAQRWFDGTYAPDFDDDDPLDRDVLRNLVEDARDAACDIRFGTLETTLESLERLDAALDALEDALD